MRFRTFWVGLVVVAVLASGYVILCHLLPENPVAGGTSLDAVLARGRATEPGASSEVDEDEAAYRYALARALKTDWELAQGDVGLLVPLHRLRQALKAWNDEVFATAYILAGGGTKWGHLGTRAEADIEDFLATVAPRLQAVPDPARSTAAETPAMLARLAAIPAIGPDGYSSPAELAKRNRDLAERKRRLREAWLALDQTLVLLPPALAADIAKHAAKDLAVLDEAR